MIMQPALSTRYTKFANPDESQSDYRPSYLVRIYPAVGLGQLVELSRESSLIGRDAKTGLELEDDSVSRRHALIERFGDDYRLTDLHSKNGTFVNDQRIESHILAKGDRIRFGNQIFKFLSNDAVETQYHEAVFRIMTLDGLTQVNNRRMLIETMERDMAMSRRIGRPLSLMMLDLDRFKSINDRHGHLAGDAVLIEFARRTRNTLRAGDVLARYGGEEFAVLLAHTTLDDAIEAAERIRRAIAESPVRFEDLEIPVTVSIGLEPFDPQQHADPTGLIEAADRSLYRAKELGRNRIHTSQRT
jgi:diguanylate cyclase (GGDEF)-like protein